MAEEDHRELELWYDDLQTLEEWIVSDNGVEMDEAGIYCIGTQCVVIDGNGGYIIREIENNYEAYWIQMDVALNELEHTHYCRVSYKFGDDGDYVNIDDDIFVKDNGDAIIII